MNRICSKEGFGDENWPILVFRGLPAGVHSSLCCLARPYELAEEGKRTEEDRRRKNVCETFFDVVSFN